ncbi:hypothetical protein I7I50_11906 [Histoplasma capsulatum G186AR]|uniref:Uncharacterized protein n=1 Tax=Ajellomyces capsulatus TaxID=5037 RepID=A0A8H8CT56_AJECA|nr:hypothetical protein I7I52_11782 [Histoplasma capsulatum]QSS70316.1 hypothetical protein I7I50_11906 [Histoplasma capsulatum G186AR]
MKPLNIEVSSLPHPLIILIISTEPSFPPLSCPHPPFKPQKQPKAKKKGEKKERTHGRTNSGRGNSRLSIYYSTYLHI